MKTTRTLKNGAVRWRANDPHGPHGKRRRRWFDSEEEARRYVKQRTDDRNSFGIWFSTMPAKDRAALGYHLQRLTTAGWSLESAVDFVLKHGRNPPSVPLEQVVEEFLTAKRVAGLRSYYVRKLSASIRRFLAGRERQPIAEITSLEIRGHIACNGWKPATMRSYLVDVKTLFAFAVKRKFLRDNPAEAVDLPRVDDKPPGILSPTQARTILDACLGSAQGACEIADTARLLVAACGCSIHSAKKALTRRGRYWDSLVVNAEGLVTWRSITSPGASLTAAATHSAASSPTEG